MPKTFHAIALSLSLLVALTAPAFAQTTDAATAPPAVPDAAAPDDLSMGVDTAPGLPTQADAQVGQTYVAGSFDKWEQRCVKTADGADPCQLYQLLFDIEGNSVAEISVFDLPSGGKAAAGATFMAPLETLLTANLRIGVDAAKERIYPFAFCTRAGCVARLGFTAEELEGFKKGIKAVLTIVPAAAPDQVVQLDLTLKGFTAGFDAVTKANAGVTR